MSGALFGCWTARCSPTGLRAAQVLSRVMFACVNLAPLSP